MFDPNDQTASNKLSVVIDKVLLEMNTHSSDSEEYANMTKRLTELYRLQQMEQEFELNKVRANRDEDDRVCRRENEDEDLKLRQRQAEIENELKRLEAEKMKKELRRRWNVSADTVVLAAANLVGILVIVGHERAHVVTSKALSLLKPGR